MNGNDSSLLIFVFVFFAVGLMVLGILCHIAGKMAMSRGYPYWVGILSILCLNLFGFLLIAFLPHKQMELPDFNTMRQCPYCAEYVREQATICRFCNKNI